MIGSVEIGSFEGKNEPIFSSEGYSLFRSTNLPHSLFRSDPVDADSGLTAF